MKTAIVYGSTLGNCSNIAERLVKKFDDASLFEVSDFDFSSADAYDLLVLGTSTWGAGDLQDDWLTPIEALKSAPLAGKKVAIFGTGDQESYSDTFVDGMRDIYDAALEAGATIVGSWSADGYSHTDSRSEIDGSFVGLALDEDNESDKSDERIDQWVASL